MTSSEYPISISYFFSMATTESIRTQNFSISGLVLRIIGTEKLITSSKYSDEGSVNKFSKFISALVWFAMKVILSYNSLLSKASLYAVISLFCVVVEHREASS